MAITIIINQLEDLVGVSLFNRTTRRIAVLPSLTINLIPELLARFKNTTPGIRVILRDDNARGVQRQVRNNESDFGISNLWEVDSKLEYTPLTHDPVGLVCPPKHPLGNTKGPLAWRKLKGFSFAGISRDTGVHKLINTPEFSVASGFE